MCSQTRSRRHSLRCWKSVALKAIPTLLLHCRWWSTNEVDELSSLQSCLFCLSLLLTIVCVFVYMSCCFVALTAPEKKEYQTIQAASEKVLAELKRLATIYAEKSKEIEQLRKELSRKY